jgi:hypothetical protein
VFGLTPNIAAAAFVLIVDIASRYRASPVFAQAAQMPLQTGAFAAAEGVQAGVPTTAGPLYDALMPRPSPAVA